MRLPEGSALVFPSLFTHRISLSQLSLLPLSAFFTIQS